MKRCVAGEISVDDTAGLTPAEAEYVTSLVSAVKIYAADVISRGRKQRP